MADAESSMRSVRTSSTQRVYYGIAISIIGGARPFASALHAPILLPLADCCVQRFSAHVGGLLHPGSALWSGTHSAYGYERLHQEPSCMLGTQL